MSRHRDVMASAFAGEGADDEVPEVTGGLSNLADCMLVLVCGLMVAFLVHYQVFQPSQAVEPTGEKVQVTQDVASGQVSSESKGEASYEKLGTLYQDTKSGQMYYLQDDTQEK